MNWVLGEIAALQRRLRRVGPALYVASACPGGQGVGHGLNIDGSPANDAIPFIK